MIVIPDTLGRQLHDKATRGAKLSADETLQVERWYAQQDRAEIEALSRKSPAETTEDLQAQIDLALSRLTVVSQRIQTITTANETLRREIANMQTHLPKQPITQSA
jgi:hypothetical protein